MPYSNLNCSTLQTGYKEMRSEINQRLVLIRLTEKRTETAVFHKPKTEPTPISQKSNIAKKPAREIQKNINMFI
jgi:hypothetical protein